MAYEPPFCLTNRLVDLVSEISTLVGQIGASCTPFVEFMLISILETLQEQRQSMQDNMQDSIQDNQNIAKLLAALGERSLSLAELMQRTGMKSRANFMKNWLQPALALNVIELTIPDKPSSRNQRYRRKSSKEA